MCFGVEEAVHGLGGFLSGGGVNPSPVVVRFNSFTHLNTGLKLRIKLLDAIHQMQLQGGKERLCYRVIPVHPAPISTQGARTNCKNSSPLCDELAGHAVGRTRGGLATKTHAGR